MKSFLLTFGSLALTAGVVANAYIQNKQFYPSVVYITKSSPSMAVLYVQAFVCVILMGKLMRKIFFGQLRAAEMEHLIERSWYAVTETCLAFTVFRDDFSPRFVALFTLLLFLKCFHWLAEDRIDYMERSPVISWLFHMRALSLLAFLAVTDIFFINHAYYHTLIKGASVQLVFGFEYAILLMVLLHIFVKYILHTVDVQNENPWENKAIYLLYTELLLGFIKVVLYMLFLAIMVKVHTFPLFAIRPMYLTMRVFKKALNDVVMSRRAIRNMNTLYPDATPEELSASDVCIICREEMVSGCKKLPCNHIFHKSCLRSWFQRQQSCPTCRMDIIHAPRPQPAQPAPPAAPPQQPAVPQFPAAAFPGAFPAAAWPGQHPPVSSAASVSAGPSTSSATSSTTSSSAADTTNSPFMPGMMPPMPFMMPPFMMPPMSFGMPPPCGCNDVTTAPAGMPTPVVVMMSLLPLLECHPVWLFATPCGCNGVSAAPVGMPPPVPLTDFSGLTEEELRAMEGEERENLEARVQCLRNIHTLLDAAMLQIHQYTAVISSRTSSESAPTSTTWSTTRPTASATPSKTNNIATTNSSDPMMAAPVSPDADTNTKSDEGDALEGAVGYAARPETVLPEDWRQDSEDSNELGEIRRRRLEKFSNMEAHAKNTDSDGMPD
ncbi:E3 ubiquitin-protein ligase synoviolin B [Lamellibrachia satsuma]|nr:E3 ubiquitin-protein ligase synoviolin B [Lamellibrachia satsuma]